MLKIEQIGDFVIVRSDEPITVASFYGLAGQTTHVYEGVGPVMGKSKLLAAVSESFGVEYSPLG